jgi:flagellar assembly protein FliH
MKSWRKSILLSAPLRNVTLSLSSPPASMHAEAPDALAERHQSEIEAAYEKGRIDGEKTLGEQLVHQRTEIQDLLNGVVASLRQAVPMVVRDTEQHMVALALEIAQKLVSEMPISVEMVEASIRDALAQVEGTAEFHVRLHPADMELLQKMNSPLLAPSGDTQTMCFHSSPEVTRGGCLVQTRFGIVDARRETKLDLLKRSLLG